MEPYKYTSTAKLLHIVSVIACIPISYYVLTDYNQGIIINMQAAEHLSWHTLTTAEKIGGTIGCLLIVSILFFQARMVYIYFKDLVFLIKEVIKLKRRVKRHHEHT